MTRVVRWAGVGVVGLAVVALAGLVPEPGAGAAETGGNVIRTAQKSRAKKKVRSRKGAPKAEEPTPDSARPAAPAPAAATEDGSLKFSRDIAPILVNNCQGCHNPKAQSKGKKLDLSTFEGLMKGTADEKVIVPGQPEESHLVLRIKGEETPKMPQGANRRLSEAAIAKVEKWVKAGAVLDAGVDPKAPMEKYAATPDQLRKLELARMSTEQRDKLVEDAGRERWKKASPKTTPEVASSGHFLLFSTLPKDRAQTTVKAVENQYNAVKSLLGEAAVDWGEKASLFVFNDAASYGEFVRALENREVESGDTGTARLTGPEPYVAVVDPSGGRDEPPAAPPARRPGRTRRGADDEAGGPVVRSLAGVLTEQFVIGAAARAGKPPRWVSLGLAALIASRVEGRTAYYAGLRREALQLCEQGWRTKANDAMGDQDVKTDEVRAVGYAIMECLSSARGFVPFVQGMLAGGEKLDDVLAKSLGATREQFLNVTGDYVMSRGAR